MSKSPVERQLVRAMRKDPTFLELICRNIEAQQKTKPRTPEELRAVVMAKHAQKEGAK
jgi:hypothetical protein